jgi:hypothetical protein
MNRLARLAPVAVAVVAFATAAGCASSGHAEGAAQPRTGDPTTASSSVTSGTAGTSPNGSGVTPAAAVAKKKKPTPARLCVGAGYLDPKHRCKKTTKLLKTPDFYKNDISKGITTDCIMLPPYPDPPLVCHAGDRSSPKKRIALVGNSHAGHWYEAMNTIGKKKHWAVDTYILAYCYVTLTDAPDYCADFRTKESAAIMAAKYDLVILASDHSPNATPELYVPTIQALVANGSNVLTIRDTPAPLDPAHLVTDCVAAHPKKWGGCSGKPRKWIHPDPLTDAAKQLKSADVFTVNLDKYICTKKSCPAVVGGVIPYRDENHLTVTFSKTLVPYLLPAVRKALS